MGDPELYNLLIIPMVNHHMDGDQLVVVYGCMYYQMMPGVVPPTTGANRCQDRPWLFPGRRAVFISARVHPGETPASYMLEGAPVGCLWVCWPWLSQGHPFDKTDHPRGCPRLRTLHQFQFYPNSKNDIVGKLPMTTSGVYSALEMALHKFAYIGVFVRNDPASPLVEDRVNQQL